MASVLTSELGHFHLDDARVEARATRTVNQAVSDQSQQVDAFVVTLLGGCRGQDGCGIQDVLESIQKADRARVLTVRVGGLADEGPDEVVGNGQRIDFLLNQVRPFAAEGGGHVAAQGSTLMRFDFIISDFDVPALMIMHGDLACANGRVEDIGHQAKRTKAADLNANNPHGQGERFPVPAPAGSGWGVGVNDFTAHFCQPTAVRQAFQPLGLDVGGGFDDEFTALLVNLPQPLERIQPGIQQEQQSLADQARQDLGDQGAFASPLAAIGRVGDVQQLPLRHSQQPHQTHLGKGGLTFPRTRLAKGALVRLRVRHGTRAPVKGNTGAPVKVRPHRPQLVPQLDKQHLEHRHAQLDPRMADGPIADQFVLRRQQLAQPAKAGQHPIQRLGVVQVAAQRQDQHQPDEHARDQHGAFAPARVPLFGQRFVHQGLQDGIERRQAECLSKAGEGIGYLQKTLYSLLVFDAFYVNLPLRVNSFTGIECKLGQITASILARSTGRLWA
jgi:hypothetical protein